MLRQPARVLVHTLRVISFAIRVYHRYAMGISGDGDGFARALADEYGVGTGVLCPLSLVTEFRPSGSRWISRKARVLRAKRFACLCTRHYLLTTQR